MKRTKQEFSDLDKRIIRHHRSTKTLFRVFSDRHNELRHKYRWYYNWHLNPFFTQFHFAALFVYTAVIAFTVVSTVLPFADKILASSAQGWGKEIGWNGWKTDGLMISDSGVLQLAKDVEDPSVYKNTGSATLTYTPNQGEVVDWLSAESDIDLNGQNIDEKFSTDNILWSDDIASLSNSETIYLDLAFSTTDTTVTPLLSSLKLNYSRLPNTPNDLSFTIEHKIIGTDQVLRAGAFTDPDSDLHQGSQWQITGTSGDYSELLLDSGTVTEEKDLTKYVLIKPLESGNYYFRVRYQDSTGAWSLWSKECAFTIDKLADQPNKIIGKITGPSLKADSLGDNQIVENTNEIVSKRTEKTKTIDNKDGTYTLESFGGVAHYKDNYSDPKAQWKDINPDHSIDFPDYVLYDQMPSTVKVFKDKIGYEIESRQTGEKYTVELQDVDGNPKLSKANGSNGLVAWADINPRDSGKSKVESSKLADWLMPSALADEPAITADDGNLKFEFEIGEYGVRLWKTIEGSDAPKNFKWKITNTAGSGDDLKFRDKPDAFEVTNTQTGEIDQTKKVAIDAKKINGDMNSTFTWQETAPSSDLKIDTDVVAYPDADAETATVDGYVMRATSSSTWAAMRDGAGTSAVDNGQSGQIVGFQAVNLPPQYYQNMYRSVYTFDTSAVPSDATVDSATFSVYGTGFSSGSLDVYTFTGSATTSLAASDFASTNFGTTMLANPIVDVPGWNTSGYNDFAFNTDGKAAITKAGITKLSLRELTYDASNNTPTNASPTFSAYFADYAGTDHDPKLAVTYSSSASAPTVTTSAATDIATTSVTGNGNVTADGGASVTDRGFYYVTDASVGHDCSAAAAGTQVTAGSGTGAYTGSIGSLTANTYYCYRSYATNSVDTSYGTWTSFQTLAITHSVTISSDGTGSGTFDQTSPKSVADGSSLDITATANASSNFTTWTGCTSTTSNVCHLTNITTDKTVTATFTLKSFSLTYSAGAHGSISGTSPQTVNYGSDGSEVTAVPDAHYHFVSWSDSVMTAARTDTNIIAGVTVTASFAIDTYTITASAGTNGSISPAGVTTKNYAANQNYTMTPAANYHVADVLVDGSSVGTAASYNFSNIIQNHTISVTFALDTFDLTASVATGQHGNISPSGVTHADYDSSVTYTISPENSLYHISDLYVDGTSVAVAATYTFTHIVADHTITATFALNNFTIISAVDGTGGTISPLGDITVASGGSQSYEIIPDSDYTISDVTVDGTSLGAKSSHVFDNVSADHTIVATFTAKPVLPASSISSYWVDITKSGSGNGTLSRASANFTSGENIETTATPDDSSTFISWTGCDSVEGEICRITNIAAERDVVARFDAIPSYMITASADENSTIEPSGEISIIQNHTASFQIKAKDGYRIRQILVDGVDAGILASYIFREVTSDHVISVVSEVIPVATNSASIESTNLGEMTANVINRASDAIGAAFAATGLPEQQASNVFSASALTVSVATAAAAPIANAVTLFTLPEYIRAIFYSLASLSTRRRRKECGKVVEAGTGIPIAQAKVDLVKVDPSSGIEKVIEATFTDNEGKFAFIAEKGSYRIEVSKDMYQISNMAGYYQKGKIITVTSEDESLVVPTIALSMNTADTKKKFFVMKLFEKMERVLVYFSFGFLIFGSITITSSLIKNPHGISSIILAVIYPFLWYMNIRSAMKVSPFGEVENRENHKGVPLALVRVMDKEGHLVKTAVTNERGKFKTLIGKGEYKILVAKAGYDQPEPVALNAGGNLKAANEKIELDKKGLS